MPRIFSLSIHAEYRCAHSGACCTAGWPIPVERATHEQLSRMIAGGTLTPPPGRGRRDAIPGAHPLFLALADAPSDTPVVTAADDHGACVFYERESGLCSIHRQAGAARLPVACRQFPRVALADTRGLFVTLSHYCPTAAQLLFREDLPLEVVEAPAAFPADFDYDPFDARDGLPPLLRPGVLTSAAAFDLWERRVVAMFAEAGRTAEAALSHVAAFTEAVRAWTPDAGELERYIERWDGGRAESARTHDHASNADRGFEADRVATAVALVLEAIPQALRPSQAPNAAREAFERWVADAWPSFAAPVRHYLAARAFASWLAYQGRGLRTIVFSLQVALRVLQAHATVLAQSAERPLDAGLLVEAIRRTDELFTHLASRETLARGLGTIESAAF